jgi:hypothetical protein
VDALREERKWIEGKKAAKRSEEVERNEKRGEGREREGECRVT